MDLVNTSVPPTPPVDSLTITLSFIIPTVQEISYTLVFLPMLEFICAQSPNAMKGRFNDLNVVFYDGFYAFFCEHLDVNPF